VFPLRDYPLEDLVPYIDWTPFFQAWDLHGKYPRILTDAVVGAQAQSLFDDAQAMLRQIVAEKWVTAHGVYGFFSARQDGDDIAVQTPQGERRFLTLRQQGQKAEGQPYLALADFIDPAGQDTLGLFAVTTGHGVDERTQAFKDANDDYRALMLQALADRLAEAFAECMHARVRRDLWGYAAAETLSNEELIKEHYQGIRPAPGYPACPDHSVKQQMFELLQCQDIGMTLTESMAMTPAASVSGFYLAHPEARYFNVGRIGDDQVHDLAKRQGVAEKDLQRLLAPNL
jgi:5-methyltetrahydrofolate--homocysteine methyltransferase